MRNRLEIRAILPEPSLSRGTAVKLHAENVEQILIQNKFFTGDGMFSRSWGGRLRRGDLSLWTEPAADRAAGA